MVVMKKSLADGSSDSIVDLHELVTQIWNKRLLVLKYAAVLLIFGIIISFSIPKEYTSTVKMTPEDSKSSITGDMSNLAAMAGINIGMENSIGLSHALYPDIIQSVPFIIRLTEIPIYTHNLGSKGTLYDYLNEHIKKPWWSYIFEFPLKIAHIGEHAKHQERIALNPYNLSIEQEKILTILKNRIDLSTNKKTGLITVGVTLQDPKIAAIVADSLVLNLEKFIIEYRTNKARKDLNFAIKVFNDSKQRYYTAQKYYAGYIDENKNIILESVRIEQEKLKNEQTLAYGIYNSLAQQLEKAKMKVQEQTPCVTIIEPARVPVEKSNTSRLLLMFGFSSLGVLIGLIKVIYSSRHIIFF
jgi:uncharacterized protein involved in exopolysaccharide biosynthesis